MTTEQLITDIRTAFKSFRPTMFIRGTCSCDECLEHEATLQTFVSAELPLEKLNSSAWDPICFASNEAYFYLLPGLVKLVLDHTDEYVSQFIFHLSQPERLESFSPQQAQALIRVLDYLVDKQAPALDINQAADDLLRLRESLEDLR